MGPHFAVTDHLQDRLHRIHQTRQRDDILLELDGKVAGDTFRHMLGQPPFLITGPLRGLDQ